MRVTYRGKEEMEEALAMLTTAHETSINLRKEATLDLVVGALAPETGGARSSYSALLRDSDVDI